MNTWIDLVNANNEIHKHLTESFLEEHIGIDDTSYLNWMNIFNSKIVLSNEFIIKFLDYIDWKYLTRALDESMLERYSRYVLNWNIQLYGPPRTFEFMAIQEQQTQIEDLQQKNADLEARLSRLEALLNNQ